MGAAEIIDDGAGTNRDAEQPPGPSTGADPGGRAGDTAVTPERRQPGRAPTAVPTPATSRRRGGHGPLGCSPQAAGNRRTQK